MTILVEDLKSAVRTSRRWPTLSITAVVILAIGIGANTAVYSLAEQVLSRPSPFREPERLVSLSEKRGLLESMPGEATFFSWRDHARTLEGLHSWGAYVMTLRTAEQETKVQGGHVRPGFFQFLGVEPFLGRGLASENGEPGSSHVVVLTHSLWRELYGGDRAALGQWLDINEEPYEVVGILPPGIEFTIAHFWIPFDAPQHRAAPLGVVGRLAPGATREAAKQELSTLAREVDDGLEATVAPFAETPYRFRQLFGLGWLSGAVLLIVCGTVASLLLARSELRSEELAIRSAIGAGRLRLTTQLLVESLFLAVLGGGLGLLFALWMSDAILSVMTALGGEWDLDAGSLNTHHLAFNFIIALGAGVLCGLIPSKHASSPDLGSTLVQASVTGSTQSRNRWRQVLVTTKVMVSFTLLMWIVLMVQQTNARHWRDPGFEPEGLWSLEIELPEDRYPDGKSRAAFHDQVLESINVLSEGDEVTLGGGLTSRPVPMTHSRIEPECQPFEEVEEGIAMTAVGPGYFDVLRQPLRQGRAFLESDRFAPQPPIVINTSLADRFWPNTNPVGRQISFSKMEDCFRIVGVVQDASTTWTHPPGLIGAYLPHWRPSFSRLTLIARSNGSDPALLRILRRRVSTLEPDAQVTTHSAPRLLESPHLADRLRFLAMTGLFVLVAVLLTTAGIYSIVTYSVSRRRAEIGVRMTLGAHRGQILRSAVLGALRPVAIGIALGVLSSLAVGKAIEATIYLVDFWHPAYLTTTAVLLLALCTVAAWIPARQATRFDPVVVLRRE